VDGYLLTPAQNPEVHKDSHRCWILGTSWVILIVLREFIVSAGLAQSVPPPAPAAGVTPNACSMPGLTPNNRRPLKAAELLDSYNTQAGLVHGLRASTIMRAKGGTNYAAKMQDPRPAPVELRFLAPAWLRMTGVIPFSARRAFDLWSDGRDFRLLAPVGKVMRFYVGPLDAFPPRPDPRQNVKPEAILEALHWIPARLVSTTASPLISGGGMETIGVEFSSPMSANREKANVEFDLRSGAVSRLEILDETSAVVTAISYSDWQTVPATAGGERSVCFPKRMLVDQRLQDLQVEMKILSMQVNPQLSPPQLQLFPPRGIPVTRLAPGQRGANP
jgi:hypothetical protein